MTKAFNFSVPLVNYANEQFTQQQPDGTVLELFAGKVLANNLGALNRSDRNDIIKFDDWARTLYEGKEIILDAADTEKLISVISNFEGMGIVVKRQLIKILSGGKEVKPPAKESL